MKKNNILFWIFTVLFSFIMLGAGYQDVVLSPVAVAGMTKLQLPHYLIPFLGIAKVLGVIAILIPGYPKIKEWAYAGLIFDLIGATYCIYRSGNPISAWAPMFITWILGFGSYYFYHQRLKNKEKSSR